MERKYVIFDLDDTLIYEIDFLKSAYREIARLVSRNDANLYAKMFDLYSQGENVFDFLTAEFPVFSKEELLTIYRNHFPTLTLNDGAEFIFNLCKSNNYKIGLITDGRSITQRNKLKAVGIESIFDKIIISEEFGSSKPNKQNFLAFLQPDINSYFYIGDNPKKDFIAPNELGWQTVCLLDKGNNVHKQNFDIEKKNLPNHKIHNLNDLSNIIM